MRMGKLRYTTGLILLSKLECVSKIVLELPIFLIGLEVILDAIFCLYKSWSSSLPPILVLDRSKVDENMF